MESLKGKKKRKFHHLVGYKPTTFLLSDLQVSNSDRCAAAASQFGYSCSLKFFANRGRHDWNPSGLTRFEKNLFYPFMFFNILKFFGSCISNKSYLCCKSVQLPKKRPRGFIAFFIQKELQHQISKERLGRNILETCSSIQRIQICFATHAVLLKTWLHVK